MADKHDLRHVVSDAPRVMVADGSKLVRKLIGDTLKKELPDAEIIGCGDIAEARLALAEGAVDLVTTALVLPDGDGLTLARSVREAAGQSYVPVIVISGSAQEALEARAFSEDITDYFDKSLGQAALAAFIRGYVHPAPIEGARVLYVEDSKVVAVATKRMLERHGMQVQHFLTAEDGLEHLHKFFGRDDGDVGADLVLSDVYLKGALSGQDLLNQLRGVFGYGKRRLPMVMMTGDDNRDNQARLLREGANDLVLKPIEERLLVTKILFQLRLSKMG
ncbi:MAG: response regulator [Thermomonas sp.]|uniref:response regulator n=1 Tax=Thermomonas sp. TaxID=1971895 RepID=UPI001ED6BC52|nr:response regulator [Thermomonas sp.]MBV2208996.1 response regulator [Thermomonas sp.]